jgi:tRNA(Ile2)-agmatinylcytidine synthase
LLIALDDTDGSDGGCTTHLMLHIISALDLDVKGFPRLVRLNPNIPFKTRGNAALCAEIGRSHGLKKKIGEYMGKPIFSSGIIDDIADYDHMADAAWNIVLQEANLKDEKTNPGMIIARDKPDSSHYFAALRSVVSIDDALRTIKQMGMIYRSAKNGRGLIGALSALGWVPEKSTYEMIIYSYPHPQHVSSDLQMEIVALADSFPGTFNNYDAENRHAAIFPSPRTPVLCGVRTTDPNAILEFPAHVAADLPSKFTGYMLYQTNQATDDHYQKSFERFEDLSSYAFNATVTSNPEAIKGGHWFFNFLYAGKEYRAAIFEPSKGMRLLVKDIEIGDYVKIFGSFMEGKMNIEKVIIIERSRVFTRSNPVCVKCGSRMQNNGRNSFVCPACKSYSMFAAYTELKRSVERNNFEAPAASRRHLVASIQEDT